MNTSSIPGLARVAGVGLAGLVGLALQAQQTQGFTVGESGLSQPIPDNDASGIARSFKTSGLAVGIPYQLTVSLSVEPTGLGAFNGDYYAYLLHESASGTDFRLAVLLNRVGSSLETPNGYSDSGFRITLSDSAKDDIHRYRVALGGPQAGLVTGTWQPDGRQVDPWVSFDTTPRTAPLSPLGLMDPNGQWTLFVADMEAGGTGKLTGWEVQALAVVPEPSGLLLLGLGLLAFTVRRGRRSV